MANHHQRPYGVGLSYRNIVHRDFMRFADEIDLVEIPTEDYIVESRVRNRDPQNKLVDEVMDRIPSLAHGISLSIGSVEPLDMDVISKTKKFMADKGLTHFSEHLAYQRMDGTDLTLFMCMPFEEVSVDWIAKNYNAAAAAFGFNFSLENVSYYFAPPNCQFDEAGFLKEILEKTDCMLLLDVTNVFNNCTNHNLDPVEYIQRLPADRISQIHLAGGHYEDGKLRDSHSYAVMQESWDLFEVALQHTDTEIVVIERDYNLETFPELMKDVRKGRELFYKHRPEKPPEKDPLAQWVNQPVTDKGIDPTAAEFSNLRGFQRSVVREIADDLFRLQSRMDPNSIKKIHPMDDTWLSRYQNCSREEMDYLAQVWNTLVQTRPDVKDQYRQWIWKDPAK